MPPCRGGKSLVTTSVRVTGGPAVSSRWASATRCAVVGCEPKNHCQAAGGSGLVEVGDGQVALHADERVGVAGQVEGVHVGPRLDVPGDEVLHRRRHQRADRHEEEDQRDDPRVTRRVRARPAAQRRPATAASRARATPAAAPSAPDERAGQHVVGGDVAELVGGDRLDLVVGQLVEDRVVDDDPPGRAEAGHVGVQRRRPAAGVGHQHVLHRGAVLLRQREQVAAQLPAGIDSNRLNAGSMTTGQRNDPTTTSAAAPSAAQAHQVRGARRASQTSASSPSAVRPASIAVDDRDVAQPQPPAPGGQAVAVPDDLAVRRRAAA